VPNIDWRLPRANASSCVLALLAPIFMQIIHLFMADLVWVALVLAAAAALGAPAATRAPAALAEPALRPGGS